mmetsp:Transcript_85494/g.151254  ORF Transcript_85494/g.151254 Transcript_85494/m.151254 type:complete len:385 (+) Transcript_85494:51-1205(+)
MGCCASSNASNVAVEKDRRRLSVGAVDGSAGAASDDKDTDGGNRGAIASLGEQSLLDVITQAGMPDGRRVSVGSQTDQGTTSFANKSITSMGDELDPASSGIGYTCRKGLKPESPNQDSWFVLKTENFSMYAVFDGHGQKGHDVSQFAKDALPKLIIKDPRSREQLWEPCLLDAFKTTQSFILTSDKMKTLSAQMSGTTATMAIHDHLKDEITIAHVADSTAAMGVKNGTTWTGEALTRDHKPNLKDEKARIEKAGGRVVFDGYANHRVYAKNARYPGLNMSRCLGDLLGHKECGMSAEPEISTVPVEQGKEQIFLVCSDGVWEFITAQEAITLVSGFPSHKAPAAADTLAKEAWDRWIKEEGGSVVDDITVVIVYLGKQRKGD